VTKRALDVVLSVLAIALLAPLGLLAALAIKLDSRGPVLHLARRIGRGGRPFTMLKFRTMFRTAGSTGARALPLTTPGDRRVTRTGRVLRALHADEWPQFVNVLRGEMSLVGPRPETPEFVEAAHPLWQRVLCVRPGLTGPSQLRFARTEGAMIAGSDPVSAYRTRVLPEKLALDAAYVEERSLAGDAACLLRTLTRVLAW